MEGELNILSFNWHEPYLWNLAKTGHRFDIVEPDRGRRGIRSWNTKIRPVPENVSIVSDALLIANLDKGLYDVAVVHNFSDLKRVADVDIPTILVLHNKLTCELKAGSDTVTRSDYLSQIEILLNNVDLLVFVSESKKEDWGFTGSAMVIRHGVDIREMHTYSGATPKALRVGNAIRQRDFMLGYNTQEEILEGHENSLIGINPQIEKSETPRSFDDLKAMYASHRLYLNTTIEPYEDGYNMAMLEAMATGMPVVSITNSSSPITDGVEGFISSDIGYLRRRISQLLDDQWLAANLGSKGKSKVGREFSMEKFITSWNKAFGAAIRKYREKPKTSVTPAMDENRWP